jgi:hypothetical protein
MGTNYYLDRGVCDKCGRGDAGEKLHIGKSSAGWCFSLHVIPEQNINTLEDWKREFATGRIRIRDEYDKDVSVEEMLTEIEDRLWGTPRQFAGYRDEADFHQRNGSEPGPNGLVRHRIGRSFGRCVAHGEGTWDYIVGEFS